MNLNDDDLRNSSDYSRAFYLLGHSEAEFIRNKRAQPTFDSTCGKSLLLFTINCHIPQCSTEIWCDVLNQQCKVYHSFRSLTTYFPAASWSQTKGFSVQTFCPLNLSRSKFEIKIQLFRWTSIFPYINVLTTFQLIFHLLPFSFIFVAPNTSWFYLVISVLPYVNIFARCVRGNFDLGWVTPQICYLGVRGRNLILRWKKYIICWP